nr:BRCT domain-containing protein At4g02110 [Setaria viridis]
MPPHADGDAEARLFAGVRFALYGFNTVSESQYRLEIERCGGVHAGAWDGDCTHVIVSGTLYDDPVCVAARKDKKKVVTEHWVEDSFELGELADADRVIYTPVRDVKGIPGSDELHICLTGYQKSWREDIMRMVSLMGAHFSKSLRASEDTHLICYKFEGEKYELARQVNIKIVNHRWLEECLKAWEILPVDDYTKSGWEVEIMEAQAKDSEDEREDVGRGSSSGRHIIRSTPVAEIRTKSHVDSAVGAPIRGPTISTSNADGATGRHLGTPEPIMKAEDASTKSFGIRADSGGAPDTKYATISVDGDAHKTCPSRVYESENCESPADQVSRDKAKGDHKREPDTRASTLCTPSVHKSIATAIPADNTKNIDRNSTHSSNQFNVNNDLQSNSSEENCSKKTVHSTEMSRKVDQKDDGHIPDPQHTISESFAEEKLRKRESNLGPEDKSASRNNQILGYSRRRSSKSVSPEANLRSVHQTTSSQCFEGNTSRTEFNVTPRKNNQDFSWHADTQGLQENEVIKHVVNRSGGGHAQRRKSILASFSSKAPNEAPDSETGISSSPLSSKESASEAAVSNLGRSPAESTKVDGHLNSGPTVNFSEKQMPGSFKSNLLSNRRTSLKLASPAEVEKLPENSANEKNMGALGEVNAPALHETTIEKHCAIFPSVNSEVRKESSGVSLQNQDTEMIDPEQVNKIEAAAPCSKPEKVVCHQELEADPKDIPVNEITDKDGTFPPKVSTSRVRNFGAKRSRNAGSKAAPQLINSKSEVAPSKPMHDKVASHENVETQQAEACCSPNAAKSTPLFPAEVLSNKSRNEVRSSSLGPNRKMNESLMASRAESVNMPLQRNTKGSHRKLSSTASVDENQGSSSQRVPNSKSSKSVAEGCRTADADMADSPTIEKTETIPSKSSFSEAVPPQNGEENHQKILTSASEADHGVCTANKVTDNRVRKVVAKRKLSAVQKKKSGSVSVSEDKSVSSARAAQSSRNANKVMVDQELQNTKEDRTNDTFGSLCKDAIKGRSKDMQSSKSRSNKRQKTADLVDDSTDYDKENIPVNSNFTSKTRAGNNSMSSKSTTKALQNSKIVLDDCGMIEGNNRGTLNMLEPTWFMLSGHRLLRKEYKAILRRLKGRVCRDSHHWCFQATHLVTTELRRTEKFFAAAAAGRWILRPDYLTACNEAGKFLEEEPFEWHGDGLNSGDTISLDAPRKWRQLKLRTGHGAFYGMRVIIYGECIAPTLDTLKRTIKSGDGTILATSPPYTRFLKSSIDFAVVSTGMPSVDAWVQEFMRHNIPCICADYLVEYVCKPGYPLSKHVLFNMHDLAEKSLQKLLRNQEDVMDADTEEEGEADVGCSTCGSNEQEGLMLTCGGSGGKQAGCGVRVHVDCCNPPVEAAPDGEWLCSKCDQGKSAKKAKKSAGKSRVLKRR